MVRRRRRRPSWVPSSPWILSSISWASTSAARLPSRVFCFPGFGSALGLLAVWCPVKTTWPVGNFKGAWLERRIVLELLSSPSWSWTAWGLIKRTPPLVCERHVCASARGFFPPLRSLNASLVFVLKQQEMQHLKLHSETSTVTFQSVDRHVHQELLLAWWCASTMWPVALIHPDSISPNRRRVSLRLRAVLVKSLHWNATGTRVSHGMSPPPDRAVSCYHAGAVKHPSLTPEGPSCRNAPSHSSQEQSCRHQSCSHGDSGWSGGEKKQTSRFSCGQS